MRILRIAALVCIAANGVAHAQPAPGAGFKHVGRLYMERHAGSQAATEPEEVSFSPDTGYALDLSYQQAGPVNFAGGDQQKATSPLRISDIPAGIYLIPNGGWYWSIQPPLHLFRNVEDSANGLPVYVFQARLYCGPEPHPGPGCNASLDVWVKQKRAPKKH